MAYILRALGDITEVADVCTDMEAQDKRLHLVQVLPPPSITGTYFGLFRRDPF